VNITVNVRPNQPPSIDDFSASPTTGGAPFTSTLTWRLRRPRERHADVQAERRGRRLRGAVGSVTVQMPGTQTVTLTVSDPYGGTVSKTVTLTAVMPVGGRAHLEDSNGRSRWCCPT